MITSTPQTRRRWAVVLIAAAYAGLISLSPAQAHAGLVSTDPVDGTVLRAAPRGVTFTFNGTVSLPPAGVTVYDAAGTRVRSEASARAAVLRVALPGASGLGDGSYVIAWRVVSADSHPVSGSLTFAVGAPSLTVAAPPATDPSKAVPVIHGILQGVQYAAVLAVVGLIWFRALVAADRRRPHARRRCRLPDRAMSRLQRVEVFAGVLAVLSMLLLVPVSGALKIGTGPASFVTLDAVSPAVVGNEWLSVIMVVTGIAAALALRERPLAAGFASQLALVALTVVGHARTASPSWLTMISDLVHLSAGALWLGGLLGLALTLPSIGRRSTLAAEVVTRFSEVAAASLGVLAVSGILLAWRIVGSWDNLVGTSYGSLLMSKTVLVAATVIMAAGNRLLVLPSVQRASGRADTVAAGAMLRRAVLVEAGALAIVLGVTGFLVDRSPHAEPATVAPAPSALGVTEAARLGEGHRVYATLTPGRRGPNTLRLRFQDGSGKPVGAADVPAARLRAGGVDLGEVSLTPVDAGAWQAEVVLPTAGTWEATVGLRISRIDSLLGLVRFPVGR